MELSEKIWRPSFLGDVYLHDRPLDLQLFAAEDEGRTEPPSERRRREEEEKGNVPKSNELPAAIVLLAGIVFVYFTGKYIFFKSSLLIQKYFHMVQSVTDFQPESFAVVMKDASWDMLMLIGPVLGVTFIAGIAGSILQVGFMFTPKALSMNFGRIKPDFKKVLPTRQTMFNLGKSLLKVMLIGWVSYFIAANDFFEILLTGNMGLLEATRLVGMASFKIFLAIGILLLAIGIGDFYYQKFEYEESLKMTPSEAKQEAKEQEGDRAILQRRRQLAREMAQKGMIQKVPTADVVITNPTHFAVALSYDPSRHEAPVVVAKGADELALLIRRIARQNDIPIVENRVQARMLYEEVEVDEPIPAKFFEAISVILSRLDKFKRQVA